MTAASRRREIARPTGGDTPLVATTITLQTALSLLAIPPFTWPAQNFK